MVAQSYFWNQQILPTRYISHRVAKEVLSVSGNFPFTTPVKYDPIWLLQCPPAHLKGGELYIELLLLVHITQSLALSKATVSLQQGKAEMSVLTNSMHLNYSPKCNLDRNILVGHRQNWCNTLPFKAMMKV